MATYYKTIIHFVDKHCPYKMYYARKELPKWINQEILETLIERDRLYKIAKWSNNPENWADMRRWRNLSNRMVAKARMNLFYTNLVNVLTTQPSSGGSSTQFLVKIRMLGKR